MEVSGGSQLKRIRHLLVIHRQRAHDINVENFMHTHRVRENPAIPETRRCVSSASHAGRLRPRKAALDVSATWNSRYIFIEYCSSF